MLHATKQQHNSVWIKADSQDELGLTFMRFQEFYESANPNFRNKIFTVGQLRNWYSETYGSNCYHIHWIGFNFPSKVLSPFKEGLFDPLTNEEQNLLKLIGYRKDNFYIIGAQDNTILRHELSHALYSNNPKYKAVIDKYILDNKKAFAKLKKILKKKGYCDEVLNDEIQAYITDNDDNEILDSVPKRIVKYINYTYNRFNHNE